MPSLTRAPRSPTGTPQASNSFGFSPPADAEDEAPAGEHVERGGDLGGDGRMAEREQVHRAAQLDAPGDTGARGEEREALVERVVEGDMVARPERIEAQLLHPSREGEHLLRRAEAEEERAELHPAHGADRLRARLT